jgi:amidase
MHGLPHAIKDMANAKDFVTTKGSLVFENIIAAEDDIFVNRIRNQGAIFIGKTNVPEFGFGSQTYNNVFGATGNAFDSELAAGGSSGGAACALALRLLPVADGSDMMGSLRNPAAYNNVVGFRPSMGRIPTDGRDVFFKQLGTPGPMGRTVDDVILLFSTMAGQHPFSPLSHWPALGEPENYESLAPNDIKVGWLADYDGYLPMEEGVLDLCESALSKLEIAGMRVDPTELDFPMSSLWQCWLKLRQWFVSEGHRPLYDNEQAKALLKPEVIWEIEQGKNLTTSELYLANTVRTDWFLTISRVFETCDILALPSAQVFPFPVTEHWPQQVAGNNMDTYHRWMEVVIGGSLSGCPVISLPAGFDHQGRAMGIQFIAPMGQDEKLLQFAKTYEEVNPWVGHYPK